MGVVTLRVQYELQLQYKWALLSIVLLFLFLIGLLIDLLLLFLLCDVLLALLLPLFRLAIGIPPRCARACSSILRSLGLIGKPVLPPLVLTHHASSLELLTYS